MAVYKTPIDVCDTGAHSLLVGCLHEKGRGTGSPSHGLPTK
jgi:hypothetical protein